MEIKKPRQKHLFSTDEQTERKQDKHLLLKSYFLYVDGASRGNPGKAGVGMVGFCVESDSETISLDKHIPVLRQGFFIGQTTNNLCEYAALVCGLFLLLKKIDQEQICMQGTNCTNKVCSKNTEKPCYKPFLQIYSDSQLMVNQLNGSYKTKDVEIRIAKNTVEKLLENFHWEITHVLRDKNAQADRLANQGIDKKVSLPLDLKEFLDKNKLLELFSE